MILHMIVMITSALQVEKAFYGVLHNTLYFNGDEMPLTRDVVNYLLQNYQKRPDFHAESVKTVSTKN